MNLDQAKQVRNTYKNLVGQKAKDIDANIYDIIVAPVDNFEEFISEYTMNMNDISNGEMILKYPSKSYMVKIIYDIDPEFVNVYYDDIDVYINRNF